MSGYKVGGVAALFSKPKEPTSESGKKLQSLFQEFHKKNYKNYARSSQENTEKVESNVEQGNGKIESQGIPAIEKKRKFSAANTESNVEDSSTKKFKKTKKNAETEPTKYNGKQHIVSEQNFPRKKKLSKAKSGNLDNDNFDALNTNETGFASNKQVSDTIFKSKDRKQTSSFIKKSKQQRLAATNGNIKMDNKEMSNLEAETNDTLFKDESEKFTKKKDKKTKKKRFCDNNLIQTTESDHTDQNLFDESQDGKNYTETPNEKSPGSDTLLKREVKDFIRKAKRSAATNGNDEMSNAEAETNGTLFKDESEKFTKRKDKKTKKRFCDNNLIQNTESDHTDQNLFDESQDDKKCTETPNEESPGSDTLLKREVKDFVRSAKRKSFGGNHKQNSQPKLSAVGEPDFIKVPGLNSEHGLNSKDSEERLKRTLFVGNLPLNTKKKALRTLFSPFGEIEQIRFHGIETDKAKIFSEDGSKVLNPNTFAADSLPGFIVFVERQSAVNALSLSGSLFKGNHITVDFALPVGSQKLYDDKRSIFIGNLPFDCKDESIWDAFSECGRMESVRIVRDKHTGIGKGFGYVQFSTAQAKENALSLDNLDIQGRPIRIKAIESNKPKQKNTNTSSPPAKNRDTFKSRAINIKYRNKNKGSGSRKTIRKIMQKQKRQHNKNKAARILQKSMKL